jgi:hypothetical protein
MNRRSPCRQPRLLALVTTTAAIVLSATMSVSYARPFGTSGYGGYSAATVVDAR